MVPDTGEPVPPGWRPFRRDAVVERAFHRVRSYLSAEPGGLLGERDGPSEATAETVDLHLEHAGLDISRRARVIAGDLETGGRFVRSRLWWADAKHPRLFPILEGMLEITPDGPEDRPVTRLELSGCYAPPLGRLGAAADTLAGHRLVLESVDRFLAALGRRLERELPPDPTRHRSAEQG